MADETDASLYAEHGVDDLQTDTPAPAAFAEDGAVYGDDSELPAEPPDPPKGASHDDA